MILDSVCVMDVITLVAQMSAISLHKTGSCGPGTDTVFSQVSQKFAVVSLVTRIDMISLMF